MDIRERREDFINRREAMSNDARSMAKIVVGKGGEVQLLDSEALDAHPRPPASGST